MIDGRNVDPLLGVLGGEAAGVIVARPETAAPFDLAQRDDEPGPSYYGLPVLQPPVWELYIPIYFWAGGAAGAAATLGAAAQLLGGPRPLVERCRQVAAAGTAAGAVLLILDLGRPLRFINMMRVVRPTSPMNVGTWILSLAGGASAASLLPGRVGDVAGLVAGVVGPPLAAYTGVLLANTAVPIWKEAATHLPPLFVASAMTAGGSVLELLPLPRRARRAVRLFSAVGKALEIVSCHRFERALPPRVARPLHRGPTGALWTAAKILGAAGLACTLAGSYRIAGGICGALAGLAVKLVVAEAGKPSARDPHATFAPRT